MRKVVAIAAVIGAVLCVATCAVLLFMRSNGDAESEWSPAWSSDQQHIAFECMFFQLSDLLDEEYPTSDICIFNRGNNELTRLTTERGMSTPTWSPNNTMLAWLSSNDSLIIWDMSTNQFQNFQSGRQFDCLDGPLEWSQDGRKIFVQGDGAVFDVEQKVFLDPLHLHKSLDNRCFNWSPDGKYVAYKHTFLKDSSGYHRQVVIMQNDQTIFKGDREINFDDHLRGSPDGAMLAWVHSDSEMIRHQLAITDVASGNTKFLTFGEGIFGISTIAWSPSGNQIAVRFWDELQVVSLSSIASSGTNVRIQKESLTLQGSSFKGLSWSPDEKYIAYESDWELYSRIWILEPSTNVQIPLISRYGE